MKILIVSPEVVPFAKTGGLADVAGALPKALAALGHDVKVIMPAYKKVLEGQFPIGIVMENLMVEVPFSPDRFSLLSTRIPGTKVEVWLVRQDEYYYRDELYQVKGKDYGDNVQRFVLFGKAVIESIKATGWKPDVIHCNDWQTALIPLYLRIQREHDPNFRGIGTVFSIHNMAYQGVFPPAEFPLTGLSWDFYNFKELEFWGNFNLLKAGIIYSEEINTVSEMYSKEIQTAEYGCGLEGLLQSRAKDLSGIINGIDYKLWDPETDKQIAATYNFKTIKNKGKSKLALQESFGLEKDESKFLIGLISRLADQKGFDLVAGCIDRIMALGAQVVILGTGEPKYHELFEREHQRFPKQMGVALKFDAKLAQMIYAGSDAFLMPSRYEPCGLGQLISLKYGTIPIVRKTGGLADSIVDYDENPKKGTGFVFTSYSAEELFKCIERAFQAFNKPKTWLAIEKNAMEADFSWDASAKEYVELYKKAVSKVK